MRGYVGALAFLLSCGDASSVEAPRGRARIGGDVVSTVDGHPIQLDEVVSLAHSARLDLEEALERRQAEELLALEAYRLGYAERAEPRLRERQRLVQALLDRIAAEVPLDSISDDDVRRRFALRRDELAEPERRTIRHIVVRVDSDADPERWAEAHRLALRLRGEWVTDPDTFSRYRELESIETFRIHAEASEPMTRGNLESVLDEAVFSAPPVPPEGAPIVLNDVYRSSGGWHVIELVRVDPRVLPELEDHVERMRMEIADERRRAALIELTEEIGSRIEVDVDEAVAARALATELP